MTERGVVLILTDDAGVADALEKLLRGDGYAVRQATSASQMSGAAAENAPDLVLLDADLKGADPFEIAAGLQARKASRDVPVIFLTGLDDVEGRLKGLESGDDLLVRPFDAREVLARVERQVTVSKVRVALRESEAKFRSVMESAIDAIISADTEGLIRSWNSAAAALFGFTEAEAIGQPIEFIIPERYRQSHQEGIRRVSSGGPSHVIGKTVELAAVRKDGSEFPVELSLATWLLDDRRYYTGIIRDITERKQAEQKFRSVTDSAIDAIISADHTGVIVSWNKAASRILGYREEEAVGRSLEIIIPERFREAHRNGMARFTARGEGRVVGTTVELFALNRDGREVPIELSLATWTVREARYYTGIIRDIGERKRAEEALRASERALRERGEELRRQNDVLEATLQRLKEAQDQLVIQEKMASLGKLSAGMAHELNNPAAALQRGAAQLRATFDRWQDVGTTGLGLDLDVLQLERVLELDRVTEERARNPPAIGALERGDREAALEDWLEERGIDASAHTVPALVDLSVEPSDLESLAEALPDRRLVALIERLSSRYAIYHLIDAIGVGSQRIVRLVEALKTYTHLDRGPTELVDVHESLESTLLIFQSKTTEGVEVVRDYDEGIPRIDAHLGEVNQVWTSILDNAIDVLEGRGRITLRTRRDDGCVVVDIEDDGPGIPDEIQSKIFDPFFTTKPPGKGAGLGLNVCRNLVVQKLHGEISVSSEPGRTRFTVRLPIGGPQPDRPLG